jgi:hypothetical protein
VTTSVTRVVPKSASPGVPLNVTAQVLLVTPSISSCIVLPTVAETQLGNATAFIPVVPISPDVCTTTASSSSPLLVSPIKSSSIALTT